jgi:hypothetical protein
VDILGSSGDASSVHLSARAQSPLGRAKVKLLWEVKPLGTAFSGSGSGVGSTGWLDSGAPGTEGSAVSVNTLVTNLTPSTAYHWRLRVRGKSPLLKQSPWFTPSLNTSTEKDFRTLALGGGGGCKDCEFDVRTPGQPVPPSLELAAVPNPSASQIGLRFTLDRREVATVEIFDSQGRRVATLLGGELEAGPHSVLWDARRSDGNPVAKGVYFCSLQVARQAKQTVRVVLK